MTVAAVGLFLLGFAASWVAGRYLTTGAAAIQGGAIGVCGVAALLFGMPQVWVPSVNCAQYICGGVNDPLGVIDRPGGGGTSSSAGEDGFW